MDRGLGITTYQLLSWMGAVAFYVVFMIGIVIQWRRPDLVPYKWFPFYEEPGDRTTPRRIRQLRIGCVLSFIFLHVMAVMWIAQHVWGPMMCDEPDAASTPPLKRKVAEKC